MNVLHYLALRSEALVILLQETYFSDAEKLVLPSYQLAGSSLSRKHGLVTFVHERLRYKLLDQSPPTSEIEWLCVDVDGYKIVNVYKPPQHDCDSWISQCFLTPVFVLAILTVVMLTGVSMTTVRTVSAWLAGKVSIIFSFLYNAKDAASFYSGRWNTDTNPDLAFAIAEILTVAYWIDVFLKSFPGHNIDLRLLHHQDLLWLYQVYE